MHRMIDTATWDDPWFAELEPDAKLVFLYLLTNRRSTAAGAFEITPRQMAFETGLDQQRISTILGELHPRVHWWPAHQVIWIRNFFKHQAANDNFTKSAQRFVADLPVEIQAAVASAYPDLVPEGVTPAPPDDPTPQDTHGEPMPTGSDTHGEPVDNPSPSNSNSSREGVGEKSSDGADAPKPKRAHRIPKDFTITDELRQFARDRDFTEAEIDLEAEKFLNYWRTEGRPKKDWPGTWRQWILNAMSRPRAASPRPSGKPTNHDNLLEWRRKHGLTDDAPADAIDVKGAVR